MKKIILIPFGFIHFSCSAQNNPLLSTPSLNVKTLILLSKELPFYENGETDLLYNLKKQKEKQLKLDSL